MEITNIWNKKFLRPYREKKSDGQKCERSFHFLEKRNTSDYFEHIETPWSKWVNDIIQQNINVEEIFYPIDQVPAGINFTAFLNRV